MSTLRSRNSKGALVDMPTIAATQVKNKFGNLLDRMQSRRAKKGMNAAFNASPKKLGRAARRPRASCVDARLGFNYFDLERLTR